MRHLGFALVLLTFPVGATAQTAPHLPQLRDHQTITVSTMLCDTVEQLETILSAQVSGGVAAGRQAYHALLTTPNAKQEPSCLVATYSVTVLDVAAVVEDVPTVDGGTTTMYILYVLAGDTPYAILSPVPVGPREFDV